MALSHTSKLPCAALTSTVLLDVFRQALVKAFEGNIIPLAAALMAKGKEGLTVLPGVTRLLNELRQVDAKSEAEGKEGFGIVTSSTKYCASQPSHTSKFLFER